MAKIVFIGAGSTVFAKNLMGDILSYPELAEDAHLVLHDIDPERLGTSEVVAHKVAEALGVSPKIDATLSRREALAGADYAITMIQVGGYKPGTVVDFEIPKKYGLRQTIADTLGIGGIMRGLRTIPVLLSMCQDMEALCPDATLLQYVNPMAMNCWAIDRASSINTVGLCHSVQGTARQLARDISVPIEEIDYICAGINHMAFYLKFERDGKDLYPEIRRVIEEDRVPDWNRTRYKLLEKFGYSVTESSEHFAEYVPWFIKRDRPELLEEFNIPLDEYITRCERQIAEWHGLRRVLEDKSVKFHAVREGVVDTAAEVAGYEAKELTVEEMEIQRITRVKRSLEYGSQIIHSMESGKPQVIYGNVPNRGLIDNLPAGCCVEVPCLVDRNGVQPTKIGTLPPQLAALMQTNINVQSLTVEAALTGKRDHIYHAAMLDPHTAAELDLDQIVALVDDLIEAHGDWLPKYQ
ncbi:MAG: alpha-glucosidase/alpha-galactosidase [Caldilineaceae bacterium]|nr:alpha-glucosidase/alpha-galactosidase [Caldilineaceae bacterium]